MPTAYTAQGTVKTIFPNDQYQEYLKKVGCETENDLNDLKVEDLFRFAFYEFKENKLLISSFCLLGEYLFYKIKEQTTKFASTLLDCSELNYYIQIKDNDSDEFNSVMKRIEDYFND